MPPYEAHTSGLRHSPENAPAHRPSTTTSEKRGSACRQAAIHDFISRCSQLSFAPLYLRASISSCDSRPRVTAEQRPSSSECRKKNLRPSGRDTR